jgi:hypothetical protein
MRFEVIKLLNILLSNEVPVVRNISSLHPNAYLLIISLTEANSATFMWSETVIGDGSDEV